MRYHSYCCVGLHGKREIFLDGDESQRREFSTAGVSGRSKKDFLQALEESQQSYFKLLI
jgi:hypothetical protein